MRAVCALDEIPIWRGNTQRTRSHTSTQSSNGRCDCIPKSSNTPWPAIVPRFLRLRDSAPRIHKVLDMPPKVPSFTLHLLCERPSMPLRRHIPTCAGQIVTVPAHFIKHVPRALKALMRGRSSQRAGSRRTDPAVRIGDLRPPARPEVHTNGYVTHRSWV
ncbi:uncharacterized protein LAESUDRAFT_249535 [Laetiporus sulphureus 93-53]|uniref:Uncharacterized protein n=1 Tax=Laetiporus sulphureus 93-53 TaxID=1314785 RepID=A0A165DIV1_9APHY|nr:uncharacterized protein LAESUDRAFT_249535 [Laetiporus sulphureus 93-53]KZT04978.1 hypothetical protein LAESUDRAFT_249535 [Laetiporus sulphureus 93-53]